MVFYLYKQRQRKIKEGEKMGIPENIKKFRKDKNMTQKALAKKAGISIASVQGYEQGKYKPKTEQLKKIATALEVSVSDINPNYIELLPNVFMEKVYGAMDKALASRRKTSDILFDQMIQQLVLRSVLPEQEYNDLMKDQNALPVHTSSYKIKTLDIAKNLNEEGWKELFQYAKYLATNPKYRIDSESQEPPEEG